MAIGHHNVSWQTFKRAYHGGKENDYTIGAVLVRLGHSIPFGPRMLLGVHYAMASVMECRVVTR